MAAIRHTDYIEKLYQNDPFSDKFSLAVDDIPFLYVLFDEITNSSSFEKLILDEFKKNKIGKFYGIIGKSGSGKSSLLNYFLSKFSENQSKVFCVKINVYPDEVKDAKDLLRHIIGQISKNIGDFLKLTPDEKEQARKLLAKEYTYTSEERKKVKLGLQAWFNIIPHVLGLRGEVSVELQKQAGVKITPEHGLDELITFINQLVGLLNSLTKIEHVIIMLDETDKIRKSDSSEISSDNAIKFFLDIVPKLANTKCSYIFVLNDQYNTEKFKTQILNEYFTNTLHIPHVSTIYSFTKVIKKRCQASCGDVELNRIWEEGCISQLFKYYQKNVLRHVASVCRGSVQKAREEGSELIKLHHVNSTVFDEEQK